MLLSDFLDKLLFLLIGSFITVVIQQYRTARSEEGALVAEHIKDVERLADAIGDYWLSVPESKAADGALAAKVRARHQSCNLMYRQMIKISDVKGAMYRELVLSLYDTGLGGDFEGHSRTSDPTRALDSYLLASEVVHLLRVVKTDIVSAARAWRMFANWVGPLLGVTPHRSKPDG